MRKVTMARAIRLPSGFVQPGDVVEVDDATFERLLARGTIVDESTVADDPVVVVDEGREVVVAPAPEPAPEPAPNKERVRPLKDAPIGEWRDYAKKAGVNPSGLKKAEIIGAVYEAEGTEV